LINRREAVPCSLPIDLKTLIARVGETAGPGEWIDITQARIDTFARPTDDLQWIHLDASRTQKELGHAPVAHGYLTLSLMAPAMYELVQITMLDGSSITGSTRYGSSRPCWPVTVSGRRQHWPVHLAKTAL
jgi:hypothetical protein